MNLRCAAVATALLVSACAGPGTMRSRAPDASFTSAKPARTIASCIASGWENSSPLGTPAVQMRLTEQGFVVTVVNPILQFNHVMADVDDSPGGGSATRYFKQAPDPWPQFDAPVERCQRAP